LTFAVIAGIASGLLTALVFRLTTDTAALRTTLREIEARFLEFRLFFEEPALIWRAQKALLWANGRALGILLPSLLILAAPMTWVILQLEKAPLRVGEPTVVTVQLAHDGDEVTLEAPPEIDVETPPVHITEDRQIVWRIRLLRPITGHPKLTARPASNVVWLKVDYPAASLWWIFWFLVISSIVTVVTIRSAALQRVQCVRLLRRAKGSPRVPPR
jgi:hypothetical protein